MMNSLKENKPQACSKSDLQKMIALVDAVMRKETDQTFLTDYPLVYKETNLQNIFIIKAKDEIVSVVPFIPKNIVIGNNHFCIGIISPTATSPNHRKKGYALDCVNACIEKMINDNIFLSVLWTEIPTFHFYEKGLFQSVRSQDWLYSCKNTDAELFTDHGFSFIK